MSQYPGPTREGACNELFNTIRKTNNNTNPISQHIRFATDSFVKDIIKSEVYKYEEGGLGSQAGWMVFFKNDILDSITEQLNNYNNKKKRIKTIIRCIGSFMVLYRKTIEKRYAPDGMFEKEASKYWNPLIWNLSPTQTKKYISYVNNN
jgi:hypothetical protein